MTRFAIGCWRGQEVVFDDEWPLNVIFFYFHNLIVHKKIIKKHLINLQKIMFFH